MKVDVKYGKDGVQETEIPDSAYIGTFYPKDVECGDPDQVIGDSIDNPLGIGSMAEFLEGGEDIVFIVNDGTRPTPTAKVLDALSKRMDLRSARYLIATGGSRTGSSATMRRNPSASTSAPRRTAPPWRSTRSRSTPTAW